MPDKSISFRSSLHSSTLDLITRVEVRCARTAQLVAGLVSELAAYSEEGVPLAPSVFICNSISVLVKQAGMGEYITLAENIPTDAAATKILKAAAGLCASHWSIFVERSEDGARCSFGVFCGSTDPASMSVEEVVLARDSAQPVIRVVQTAVNRVEVRTNNDDAIEFRFNDDVDVDNVRTGERVRLLAEAVCINAGVEESFTAFIHRLIETSLLRSHGALLAVVSNEDSLPPELSDIVIVQPPIDLAARFKAHIDGGKTSATVSALQSAADLVAGLIGSDGITVLSATGKVVAYRGFVSGGQLAAPGGARRRAFAALEAMVGAGLNAALFRSQDGRTEVKVMEGARDE